MRPSRRRQELKRSRRKAEVRRNRTERAQEAAEFGPNVPTMEDRLEQAAEVTARYGVPPTIEWSRAPDTVTEKLLFTAWLSRYWKSGPVFQRRVLREVLKIVLAIAVLVALVIIFK